MFGGDANLWQPTATLLRLQQRAALLQQLRRFFAERGVLEVETPQLSHAANSDPYIESFALGAAARQESLYLHTSPEFAMKRLLASGAGAIYQICKVFRQGEEGRLHNPEFTMLEWYRPGFAYRQLMDEVEALLSRLLPSAFGLQNGEAAERLSYGEVMQRYAAVDPFCATPAMLDAAVAAAGIDLVQRPEAAPLDRQQQLDLLLTHVVDPALKRNHKVLFIYDFPAAQASLARLSDANPEVAERFELYLNGIEIANGFAELTDAAEQQRRFHAELALRQQRGQPCFPIDNHFLNALVQGMPEASGVALGVDRLLLAISGADSLAEVMAFPFDRA
ncbi:MAG: EF-P lysine aminoacylase GenX [Gammaproteobacteria bacterium]|nr:EF-P lysine aminoacylase GenX [Gammaproteobacteria bacterium]